MEDAVVKIASQYQELTPRQLRMLIQTNAPSVAISQLFDLDVEQLVQKLFKEGRVLGHVESGYIGSHDNRPTKIFFDVANNHTKILFEDANNRFRSGAQSKIVQDIKKTVLDLGTKFTRLQVAEIVEICKVPDEALIIITIQDMIAKHQIDAQYFTSTKAVAFNQQANVQSRDAFVAELEAEFANWGKGSKDTKKI